VPILQKRIIAHAKGARVPVITATQMLESMTQNPRPTRAEASDVANAIFDGTDAVMLSGETAVGNYPVESVEMMRRIAEAAERSPQRRQRLSPIPMGGPVVGTFANAACYVAAEAAENLNANAIVAFTTSGSSARLVSQYRPDVPIIAATTTETACRRSALYWGVTPLRIPKVRSTDAMIQEADRRAVEAGLVKDGDTIVIIAGTPIGSRGTTNLMKLHRVGELLDVETFERDMYAIRQQREAARGRAPSRITVDAEACIGCHLCARLCPFFIFEMCGDTAVVAEDKVPRCSMDFLCVERCPTNAIKIEAADNPTP
jgi:pyruvate kinase